MLLKKKKRLFTLNNFIQEHWYATFKCQYNYKLSYLLKVDKYNLEFASKQKFVFVTMEYLL